jgi:hypothetical protein
MRCSGFPASQELERASKPILRFLERRAVIILVTAPGDGEVTVVTDQTRARPWTDAARDGRRYGIQPPGGGVQDVTGVPAQ